MRWEYRKLPAAAVGVLVVVSGAVLWGGSPAVAAPPPASLALSSPAAGARGVTYTVRFTPSATVNAGTGTLTLTAPRGTVLPKTIADVADITAGKDLGPFGGGTLTQAGAAGTWAAAASLPAGDVIALTLAGVTNPPAGTYSLTIATSAQKTAISTAPYHMSPPRAPLSPIVSFPQPVFASGQGVTYPVQFTASPSGDLVAGHGTITLTAAKGTILPLVIADVYDVTAGTDLGPLPGGVLFDNGAAGTWTVTATIPAGHVIDLRLDGVTDPAEGSYQLGIATSSDTVTAKAPYTVFGFNDAFSAMGDTSIEDASDSINYGDATVQACSATACVSTQSSTSPEAKIGYDLNLPGPGWYTFTAYPATENTGIVGQATVGPIDFTTPTSTYYPDFVSFQLPPVTPEPSGVTFDGQSGTVPAMSWSAPGPLSVPGCQGGTGVAVVSSVDPATGSPDAELGLLTESPAGSGTYTATVPPLYPAHGPVTIGARTACSPQTALLPGSGPAQGGNQVQLTGSGFTAATAVLFGGRRAHSFTVISDTEIDAVAPAGSGTVAVSVVTPHAEITSASLAQYTYLSVGSLYPASGPATGGQPVTITGSGLSGVQAVYFGATPAAHVDVVSGTEVTATVPGGKPGTTVPVTILTADGGQTSAGNVTFTYWNPPAPPKTTRAASSVTRAATPPASPPVPSAQRRAASVSQAVASAARPAAPSGRRQASVPQRAATGPAGAFEPVSPFAEQLGAATGLVKKMAASCDLAGTGAAFVNQLNGVLARISGDVGQSRGWLGLAGGLTGDAAGYLAQVMTSPLQYPFDGLQDLTLGGFTVPELIAAGTLLSALNDLARHGVNLNSLRAEQDCAAGVFYPVPASAPPATAFSVHVTPSVTVVDTNGHPVPGATVTLLSAPDAAQPFSVLAPGSPDMDPSVNPQTTDASGTVGWDIIGGRYEVTAQKTGCTRAGDHRQSVVTSPVFQGLPPETDLTLTLSCPAEAPPSAPAVTGLSAASGPAGGGAQVDVQGSGFTNSANVTFGAKSAVAVTVVSPAELLATVPPGAGTVDVRVRTSAGVSVAAAVDRYTYAPAPVVTRIAPVTGPANGGTVVTIEGTGFAPGDLVTFGQALAATVTVASATRIVAVSPPGAGGPANVTVTTGHTASKTVTADVFSYTLAPSFTTAATATAVKGKGFQFTVRTRGYPVPALAWSGTLPPGLRIRKGNGTLIILGTPTAAGRFTLHLTARNSTGTARQTLTITVKT